MHAEGRRDASSAAPHPRAPEELLSGQRGGYGVHLKPGEYAELPLPIECEPLPPSVTQQLAAGEGLAVAAAGFRKYSQLEWCLAQQEAEHQRRQTRTAILAQQTEQPARAAMNPAAQAAARPAAALSSSSSGGSEDRSGSEGMVSSDALHMHSRASAVPQALERNEKPEEVAEASEGEEGDLAAMLEHELTTDAEMVLATEPAAGDGAAAGDKAAAVEEAAPSCEDEVPTATPAAAAARKGKPASAWACREQRQGRWGAVLQAATGEPAGEPAPAAQQTAAAAAGAASGDNLPMAGLYETGGEDGADQPLSPAAAAVAEADSKADAVAVAGGRLPLSGERKRPSAQGAAMEAGLRKLGERSWPEFCGKLLAAADQREAATASVGGRRGRGCGRTAGRGKGRGRGRPGAAAAGEADLSIQDVLNKNSRMYNEAFAAAYHEAKEQLEKKDSKRQKKEALQEHSKLVSRWSELSAQEHAWYLQHQGQALAGSDARRWELLQERVAEERQQYYAHVQQKAKEERYLYCSDRQAAQLDEDAKLRRQHVQQHLPRCYRLREVLPVPTAQAPAPTAGQGRGSQVEEPQLQHLATLQLEGLPPLFMQPPDDCNIPGDRIYLPCAVPAAPGSSGGKGREYRKAEVPPLDEDPQLAQLVQQVVQERQWAETGPDAVCGADTVQPVYCLAASAFVAVVSTPMLRRNPAWEIPVTIQPLEPATAAAAGGTAGAGVASAGQLAQRELAAGGSNHGRVMVCLEKPLQPQSLLQRTRQQRLQKYAVLSLGVQQVEAEEQQQQEQQQQPQTRRSTRGASAASAVAPLPAGSAQATVTGLQPREASYDSWQLGSSRLLLRSHGRLLVQLPPLPPPPQQQQQHLAEEAGGSESPPPPPPPGANGDDGQGEASKPRSAVLAITTEYLPETDLEETSMEELCCWWLKLLLRPAVDALLVAHVHVPKSKLMCCESLTAADIEQRCSGEDWEPGEGSATMRRLAAAGLGLLQQLLGALGGQPQGRYLLAHSCGEHSCCLYRALPPEVEATVDEEEPPQQLPTSAAVARPGTIYDLHAAHQRSGGIDKATSAFQHPRWRPFDPNLPQIPCTFPPRVGQMGRKYAKARHRKALPYAWQVMGQGGDFDQVGHVAQISRTDYMQGVEEGL